MVILSISISFYPLLLTVKGIDTDQMNNWAQEFYTNIGKQTFNYVNKIQNFFCISIPLIVRILLLLPKNRQRFIQFWNNFTKLLEHFHTFIPQINDTKTGEKFKKQLWLKFLLHFIISVVVSLIGIGVFVYCVITIEGSMNKIENYIVGLLQVVAVTLIAMMQLVSLYVIIYIVAIYHYFMSQLVEILKKEYKSSNSSNLGVNTQHLIQLYSQLDESVEEFNDLFSLRLNLEILYSFVCFLFFMYCLLIMKQMEYGVVLINLTMLGVFMANFYWLGSDATGLEIKSRAMNKLMRKCYHYFCKDVECQVFV
jgi:hypothetical protein